MREREREQKADRLRVHSTDFVFALNADNWLQMKKITTEVFFCLSIFILNSKRNSICISMNAKNDLSFYWIVTVSDCSIHTHNFNSLMPGPGNELLIRPDIPVEIKFEWLNKRNFVNQLHSVTNPCIMIKIFFAWTLKVRCFTIFTLPIAFTIIQIDFLWRAFRAFWWWWHWKLTTEFRNKNKQQNHRQRQNKNWLLHFERF